MLLYAGVNSNSTRGLSILKVQELVFWRDSGFLDILHLSSRARAEHPEYQELPITRSREA